METLGSCFWFRSFGGLRARWKWTPTHKAVFSLQAGFPLNMVSPLLFQQRYMASTQTAKGGLVPHIYDFGCAFFANSFLSAFGPFWIRTYWSCLFKAPPPNMMLFLLVPFLIHQTEPQKRPEPPMDARRTGDRPDRKRTPFSIRLATDDLIAAAAARNPKPRVGEEKSPRLRRQEGS